ncbi:hypothetical protein [Archaeoglobus sp.]
MPKRRKVFGSFWLEPEGNFFGLKINGKKKYVPSLDNLLEEIGKELRRILR